MPRFPTPNAITVAIEVVGDVRITASDREDTTVEVRPGDPDRPADLKLAEATRVDLTAGRLTVTTPKSWRRFTPFGGRETVDVTVELPTGSSVSVESGFGALTTEGELGTCRVRTGMGDVRLDATGSLSARSGFGSLSVERVDGDADVTAGSGAIRVGHVAGGARLRNANGATTVDHVGGELRAKAANGDIIVGRAARSVTAKTACGDVRILGAEAGTVVAESAAGEIEVDVRPGTAAWVDAATRFGRVRNALDAGGEPTATESSVQLRCRTNAGDILIGRAAEDGADTPTLAPTSS